MLPQVASDPSNDFGNDWIDAWTRSENYRIWNKYTNSHLFDIVEPKHPCAGGLTIDDVQRRIAQQVQDFHLDERFATGKEVLGRNLQAGREKASTVFNKLYADMEALRESQRRKHEEQRALAEKNGQSSPGFSAPNLDGAKQTMQSVGSKAGAYLGSWGTWVGEKRKTGWGRNGPGAGKKEDGMGPPSPLRVSMSAVKAEKPTRVVMPVEAAEESTQLKSQDGFEEQLFDAEAEQSSHMANGEGKAETTIEPAMGSRVKTSLDGEQPATTETAV